MRRLGLLTLFGATALLLSGCATMRVSSFVERAADFSQYRTWSWATADALPTSDPRLDNNGIFRDHFEGAVERSMAAKGYVRLPGDMSPDLLLHYHANVTRKFYVDTSEYNYSGGAAEPRVVEYAAGTLVLDVVDRRTKRLVWRGWAEDVFDAALANQDVLDGKTEQAVRRMLEQLPSPPLLMSGVRVNGY